ncbi:hypothetical protein D3C87_1478530 [compost metagenome]
MKGGVEESREEDGAAWGMIERERSQKEASEEDFLAERESQRRSQAEQDDGERPFCRRAKSSPSQGGFKAHDDGKSAATEEQAPQELSPGRTNPEIRPGTLGDSSPEDADQDHEPKIKADGINRERDLGNLLGFGQDGQGDAPDGQENEHPREHTGNQGREESDEDTRRVALNAQDRPPPCIASSDEANPSGPSRFPELPGGEADGRP